jgi:hypothetical protein
MAGSGILIAKLLVPKGNDFFWVGDRQRQKIGAWHGIGAPSRA